MKHYLERVEAYLKRNGRETMPARHALAWVLAGGSDLCALDERGWSVEIDLAIDCIRDLSTPKESEALALSYGL